MSSGVCVGGKVISGAEFNSIATFFLSGFLLKILSIKVKKAPFEVWVDVSAKLDMTSKFGGGIEFNATGNGPY